MSRQAASSSQTSTRRNKAVGRVLLWEGGSLWVGRNVGLAETHAHYAIQITLALNGEFLIRVAGSDQWERTHCAILQSDVRHEFDGGDATLCLLFVEPEGIQGRNLRTKFRAPLSTNVDVRDGQAEIDALATTFARRGSNARLLQSARAVLDHISATHQPASLPDTRITAAMQWIRGHLNSEISLEDAAASVHLSPSRFRHLFVAQTGISFRAYLRWARVECAVGAAFAGKTWTEAAQAAGFADSAHLSRTCRRMFGMSPNTLVPE